MQQLSIVFNKGGTSDGKSWGFLVVWPLVYASASDFDTLGIKLSDAGIGVVTVGTGSSAQLVAGVYGSFGLSWLAAMVSIPADNSFG